jgi:hypothetical protein
MILGIPKYLKGLWIVLLWLSVGQLSRVETELKPKKIYIQVDELYFLSLSGIFLRCLVPPNGESDMQVLWQSLLSQKAHTRRVQIHSQTISLLTGLRHIGSRTGSWQSGRIGRPCVFRPSSACSVCSVPMHVSILFNVGSLPLIFSTRRGQLCTDMQVDGSASFLCTRLNLSDCRRFFSSATQRKYCRA